MENYINPALKGKELWYFYADWCPYCKEQTPIVDDFASENPDVTIIRIESKDFEAIDHNKITSFPTHVVFVNGEYIKTYPGLQQKDSLESMFA